VERPLHLLDTGGNVNLLADARIMDDKSLLRQVRNYLLAVRGIEESLGVLLRGQKVPVVGRVWVVKIGHECVDARLARRLDRYGERYLRRAVGVPKQYPRMTGTYGSLRRERISGSGEERKPLREQEGDRHEGNPVERAPCPY
jgi:hypothetical protein